MSTNIFQELQILAEFQDENISIENDRKILGEIVQFFKSRDWQLSSLEGFSFIRSLSLDTLLKADGFMWEEEFPLTEIPTEYGADRFGLFRKGYPFYQGRFVYPVKDVTGEVMGFTGYDKFEPDKYRDSINIGYRSKSTTFYGMEKLPEYYRSSESIFITEGIVDCLLLREWGFQSMAILGSYLAPYMVEILKRFKSRLIGLPDSDETGVKLRNSFKRNLPLARVYSTKLAKDLDDQRLMSKEISESTKEELKLLCSNRFVILKNFL